MVWEVLSLKATFVCFLGPGECFSGVGWDCGEIAMIYVTATPQHAVDSSVAL